MRPGSVTSKVNRTYFASLGPSFAFTASEVSSRCETSCHCGLSAGNFALEIAIFTSPLAPRLRNEMLSTFSIFANETKAAGKRANLGVQRCRCAHIISIATKSDHSHPLRLWQYKFSFSLIFLSAATPRFAERNGCSVQRGGDRTRAATVDG